MVRMPRTANLILALFVLCLGAAAPGAAAGLSARLEADGFFGRAERAVVTVTLSNDTTRDLYLLRWQTPLAGLDTDLFLVTRDGEPVTYLGRLVKFGRPTAADYVRIPAGGSRSTRVDLGRYYDLSRSGEYAVQLHMHLQATLRDGGPVKTSELAEVDSNVVQMAVERDDSAADFLDRLAAAPVAKASTSFVGCSSGQQSALNTARSNASTYSSDSVSYLGSHTASTAGPRYTTWFGTATSSNYSTVSGNFTAIRGAWANANVTFDCTCAQSYYAYVYPTQPYRIYLCNAFWSAPATGTDSKAGTLVHEMSHFNVVAGTDDHAYGQTACKRLAQRSPKKAINNADSHEYFAENTPRLN